MLKINRAFLGMFLLAGPLAAGGACSDSSEEEKATDELSAQCTLNSECKKPLVCAFQRCHAQCDESRDCPTGQRCVKGEEEDADDAAGVCQLPIETECSRDSDCNEDQFCARDGECRDGCEDDGDCVGDQECTASGACADPEEVEDGDVPAKGEGGAGGAPSSAGGEGGGGEPPPKSDGGAGGAGGASTGGTGGNATGGTATGGSPSGDAGAPAVDDCTVKDVGNDDRNSATPVEFGQEVEACLQSIEDKDFYEFTTPEEPVQGGYVTLSLSNVGDDGNYYLTAWSATDNGEIPATRHYGAMGENGALWFPAAPGQTFRASIEPYSVIPPEYMFLATFTPFEDTHEPNDSREEAQVVEKDTDINGHLFRGFSSKASPGNDADWYQVDLDAGTVTVTFTGPPKVGCYIRMHNDTGAQVSGGSTYVNPGVDHSLTVNNVAIGTYYFVIEHYTGGMAWSHGTTVPTDLETQPYTFRITQE